MVSSSDCRLSISVRCQNHEVKGRTKKELPKEKTTTKNPSSNATRPRNLGTMRSERGVGRVRSETAAIFDLAVLRTPFLAAAFVALRNRLGERGMLEVLLPRAISTFCPFWRLKWDHPQIDGLWASCLRPKEQARRVRGMPQFRQAVLQCATTGCTWRRDHFEQGRPS